MRESHHAALANMENVVATAIGLYRFNKHDDRPGLEGRRATPPRTLLNSYSNRYSWPCVLVLVNRWREFAASDPRPEQVVPPYLYLPDGRLVPTCVIYIQLDDRKPRPLRPRDIQFPDNLIGGGCGLFTAVQGDEHVGTVSCLVTDGERTYALTSRHVCGPPGQKVFTRRRGESEEIGLSHLNQAKALGFRQLYPGYPGEHVLSNLDAGLIEITDLSRWTSQVLGIGELGEVADLHPASITLGLIGRRLRASGAASGWLIKGEIVGLFPRYRTVGGVDYLGDLLIAPQHEDGKPFLRPGDSGALWVLDREDASPNTRGPAIPVATTWGAMNLQGGGQSHQLAFAAFLSSICKRLDVELVTDHNTGWHPIWGQVNHSTIARIAGELIATRNGLLPRLLAGDQDQRAERLDLLERLAYLPDDWKGKGKRMGSEITNHFANLDLEHDSKTLSKLQLGVKEWYEFYRDSGHSPHGAIPFRVGQVFDEMVSLRASSELRKFFAAGGVLAHYVADCCNPAHLSSWGRGDPDWDTGHSAFHGVWDNWPGLVTSEQSVKQRFEWNRAKANIKSGSEAAQAALDLMRNTARRIDVGDYVSDDPADSKQAAVDFCNSSTGTTALTKCVTEGCQVLISLWRSAWKLGSDQGAPVSEDDVFSVDLAALYNWALRTKGFLPSMTLKALYTALET